MAADRVQTLGRWPKLFHNLRASYQTDLAERFPLHCVVEWLGNSERVAMKHYLQVTNRQFSEAAGVAQGVAPAQAIGNQGISENSPTLKNKAFPVIDHHDLSQEMPEWAMRDSNFCRFLRDLERFVLSATQNPTHICTRRLSLSSSN